VLLDYDWTYQSGDTGHTVIEEEPAIVAKGSQPLLTVLAIHDAGATRSSTRCLSEALLKNESVSKRVQILSLDLRGHGNSEATDYSPPHTIKAAAGDIMDLVGAICGPYEQPKVVVGFGNVGSAVAMQLLINIKTGAITDSTHSEVSGSGSLAMPRNALFILGNCHELRNPIEDKSSIAHSGGAKKDSPPDKAIVDELIASAAAFWAGAGGKGVDTIVSLDSSVELAFVDTALGNDLKAWTTNTPIAMTQSAQGGLLDKGPMKASWLGLSKSLASIIKLI